MIPSFRSSQRVFVELATIVALASLSVGFRGATPAYGQAPTTKRVTPSQTKISGIPPAVREEIERLISDDPAKRATAAASLGEMGPAAAPAIPYLVAALDDTRMVLSLLKGNVSVNSIVLDTLRLLGEPARKGILNRLAPPENAQFGAIWAVAELREARAVPLLTAIVFDRRAHYRWQALDAMETLQERKVDLATLLPLIDPSRADEDKYFTSSVIDLFRKGKDKRGVPALIALLPNSEIDVVPALGDIGDLAAVEPLIRALKDKKKYLFEIARSLAQFNDSRAVGPLVAALQEYRSYAGNEGAAHDAVVEALQKLTGTGQNFSDSQWVDWWKKNESRFPH